MTEQLAGDLLPAGDDDPAHLDRSVAAGFIALEPSSWPKKRPEQIVKRDALISPTGQAKLIPRSNGFRVKSFRER